LLVIEVRYCKQQQQQHIYCGLAYLDKKQERKITEKRCKNGMPKSTQTRKDKSDDKYTKPHPSLHNFTKE